MVCDKGEAEIRTISDLYLHTTVTLRDIFDTSHDFGHPVVTWEILFLEVGE